METTREHSIASGHRSWFHQNLSHLLNEKTEIKKAHRERCHFPSIKWSTQMTSEASVPTHPPMDTKGTTESSMSWRKVKAAAMDEDMLIFLRVAVDGGHILLLLHVSNTVRMVGYTKPTQHENWIEINDSLTSWKGQKVEIMQDGPFGQLPALKTGSQKYNLLWFRSGCHSLKLGQKMILVERTFPLSATWMETTSPAMQRKGIG